MAAMQETGSTDVWERRWGWGGIAFVGLLIAWIITILALDPAAFDSTDEEIRSFFAPEGGDSNGVLIAGLFLGLAILALLGFLGTLRTVLRRAEGGTGRLSAVAFAGGILMAGILLLLNSITVGISLAVAFEDIEVDPAAYRLVDSIFFGLLMHLGVASAVLIAATSVVSMRTGLFPSWLTWGGIVVAVLAFFSVILFGLPLFLVILWVLAVSLMLLRAPTAPRPAPPTGMT